MTATPSIGTTFAGWSGGCSGTGACVVTISESKNATATFTRSTYAVNLTKTGDGAGIVTSDSGGIDCGSTCSKMVAFGTTVTLTATASTGTFTGWSGACSGTGNCVIIIDELNNVTATFANQYWLNVASDGNGSGQIRSNPQGIVCGGGGTCSALFDAGATITLTASSAEDSNFSGWSGACSGTGTCTITAYGAKNVKATFALPPTATPTATPTRTAVPTTTPSATPTETASPTATATETTTATPTETASPTATAAGTTTTTVATETASPTSTPTELSEPTGTPSATPPPTGTALITPQGNRGAPGSTILITGQNFLPNQTLDITVKSRIVLTITADATGQFNFELVFGIGAPQGTYPITATVHATTTQSEFLAQTHVFIDDTAPVVAASGNPEMLQAKATLTVFLPVAQR